MSVEEAAVDPGAGDAGGADLGAVGGTRFASSKVAATLGLWESSISRMAFSSESWGLSNHHFARWEAIRPISPRRIHQFARCIQASAAAPDQPDYSKSAHSQTVYFTFAELSVLQGRRVNGSSHQNSVTSSPWGDGPGAER